MSSTKVHKPEFIEIATAFFHAGRNLPDLNWTEPRTGCAARAELIGLHLMAAYPETKRDIKIGKIWALTREHFLNKVPKHHCFEAHIYKPDLKRLPSRSDPKKVMRWKFHVAVTVDFPDNTTAVIDAGIFNASTTIDRWKKCFIPRGHGIEVKKTTWGEPPRHGKNGSPYFPFIPTLAEGENHNPAFLAERHMSDLNTAVPVPVPYIRHKGDVRAHPNNL